MCTMQNRCQKELLWHWRYAQLMLCAPLSVQPPQPGQQTEPWVHTHLGAVYQAQESSEAHDNQVSSCSPNWRRSDAPIGDPRGVAHMVVQGS